MSSGSGSFRKILPIGSSSITSSAGRGDHDREEDLKLKEIPPVFFPALIGLLSVYECQENLRITTPIRISRTAEADHGGACMDRELDQPEDGPVSDDHRGIDSRLPASLIGRKRTIWMNYRRDSFDVLEAFSVAMLPT